MSLDKPLGKYLLLELLGSGATSDVYLARDTVLGREVAVKVLKPALVADSQSFMRFVQESRSAAELFNDHIATILDTGEADGRYFIVMRYIPGKSLDRLLREHGRLSWDETLNLASQIGAALDYAHKKGLIHRDVKPSNILRTPEGEYILTDFGLVRAMMTTGLTSHTGAVLGTPAYIAPEIWKGEPASQASDQYSLACVLVEALTGRVLFTGETPVAILYGHVEKGAVLPETWPPGVPLGVTFVLRKGLSKNPAERFLNSGNLARALEDITKEPVHDPQLLEPTSFAPKITEPSLVGTQDTKTAPFPDRLYGLTRYIFPVIAATMGWAWVGGDYVSTLIRGRSILILPLSMIAGFWIMFCLTLCLQKFYWKLSFGGVVIWSAVMYFFGSQVLKGQSTLAEPIFYINILAGAATALLIKLTLSELSWKRTSAIALGWALAGGSGMILANSGWKFDLIATPYALSFSFSTLLGCTVMLAFLKPVFSRHDVQPFETKRMLFSFWLPVIATSAGWFVSSYFFFEANQETLTYICYGVGIIAGLLLFIRRFDWKVVLIVAFILVLEILAINFHYFNYRDLPTPTYGIGISLACFLVIKFCRRDIPGYIVITAAAFWGLYGVVDALLGLVYLSWVNNYFFAYGMTGSLLMFGILTWYDHRQLKKL
jgi:serine/threonine protein kinase